MLRALRYLNASMRSSRFLAVELVHFAGADHAAFEARVVAAAEPPKGITGTGTTALAGVDDLCTTITDDDYRRHLQDLFAALAILDGLSVFWGTTGCSLRVAVPDRGPLSIGWIFPPATPAACWGSWLKPDQRRGGPLWRCGGQRLISGSRTTEHISLFVMPGCTAGLDRADFGR